MRLRTVIAILVGVVLINAVTVLGVWLWLGAKAPKARTVQNAGEQTNSLADPVIVEAAPAQLVPQPSISSVDPLNAGTAWAEITSPVEGAAVPRRFPATGRCGSLPAGSSLMLVIDSGRSVYSPKFPLPTVTGETWSGMGNDFGAPVGGSISLCIFAVSDEGVKQLAEWQARGKATGKYPPFRGGVPGGVELARTRLFIAR
jgi:hypothetical protein